MRTPEQFNPGPAVLPQRRLFLSALAGAVAAPAALGQRDWNGNDPVRYPDPDIVTLDKRFAKYKTWNTPIQRLHTGMLWAEGPAWNGVGRYLVWSDIPNNVQLRWLDEDGHVSVFRNPAGNSNGNTFDCEGRQISCEHGNRRVVRYEHDGTVTVLADKLQGQAAQRPQRRRRPSRRRHLVHRSRLRHPGELRGQQGRAGDSRRRSTASTGKTGKIDKVTDELFKPNGLCFSPDYKKLYIADTGASHYEQAPKNIMVYDVVDGKKLRNGREFALTMELNGKGAGLADGIRADIDGNIWAGAGWVGEGYDGVHVFAPDGARIGHDPAAGDLRQPLLRRPQAQPPLHGRQPVALCRVRRDPGRTHYVSSALAV